MTSVTLEMNRFHVFPNLACWLEILPKLKLKILNCTDGYIYDPVTQISLTPNDRKGKNANAYSSFSYSTVI